MSGPDVLVTLSDGGSASVSVPQSSVQVVIGCSASGTAGTITATRSTSTLLSTFSYGPLLEAAAMSALAGGSVLAMKAPTITAAFVVGSTATPLVVSAATNATPIVVTTTTHGLATGNIVTIASVGGNAGANGTFTITVLTSTTFSLNNSAGSGAYTSGGTVQPLGTTWANAAGTTGTSNPTITGAPYDDFYVKLVVTTGGTIGVTGMQFKFSLDAGRNFSPVVSLGTANTYAIPQTNITLNFSAGTWIAGDTLTFSTRAPAWANAGITSALTTLGNSQYAIGGWGSIHVVGIAAGADATAVQGGLDTLATGQIYTGAILSARDASPPALYGGTGETGATWQAAIALDYAAVSAKRIGSAGGYYNMRSNFPVLGVAFNMRRPLAWAWAARQVQIAAQVHAGRVSDGALAQIVLDPVNDPLDGFVYWDERINSGVTSARFAAAKTRVNKQGYYLDQPNMMSPTGSVFTIWPLRAVMDVGCSILTQVSTNLINSDIRLNANGTIYDAEAKTFESKITQAINDNMTAFNMLSQSGPNNSGVVVTVDRNVNVRTTKAVNIAATLYARGYVLQINLNVGYAT